MTQIWIDRAINIVDSEPALFNKLLEKLDKAPYIARMLNKYDISKQGIKNFMKMIQDNPSIVADEIEKCGQLGIAVFSGEFVVALGETVQERQDVIGGYFVDGMVTKFLTKFTDDKFIRASCIFFWILPGDTRENSCQLVRISFGTSFG